PLQKVEQDRAQDPRRRARKRGAAQEPGYRDRLGHERKDIKPCGMLESGDPKGGQPMKAKVLLVPIAALAGVASLQVLEQQPQGMGVGGTIEKLDGNVLSVKTTEGQAMHVKLTDDARIVGVVKASMRDIKEGMFIGSAAMPQADGSQKSLEIHIFPEAMR